MTNNNPIEFTDMSQPVLKKSIGIATFTEMLRAVADSKYPHPTDGARGNSSQAQYRHYIRSIELFDQHLKAENITTVNPDEKFIDDFYRHLRKNNSKGKDSYWSGLAGNIRTLTNGLPAKHLNRPLLSPSQIKATKRFDHLTKKSKVLIKDFIANGRKTTISSKGKFKIQESELKPSTKKNAIDCLLIVLKETGLNDLTKLTAQISEDYNDTSARANHYLNDVRCIYKYLHAVGKSTYPLGDIPFKEVKSRNDFASVSAIEQILDLSDMFQKWTDFQEVRNRAMSIFLYDFASRINASSLLTTDDIQFVDDYVEVRVRPETVKGDKELVYLYNYFPQTVQVMQMYLKLRNEHYPETDAVFVSMTRKSALSVGGARNAVKSYLKGKGLTTNSGKDITPHLIRHGFSSINQGDSGLCLPREIVQDRLGHSRKDVLGRHYTHSSRELALESHKKRMVKIKLEKKSMEDDARKAEGRAIADTPPSLAAIDTTQPTVTEEDALNRLSKFTFTVAGLRKHCTSIGKAFKSERKYYYSESWVDDIAQNWMTKQDACRLMNFTGPQYFHWSKNQGVGTVVVGMVSIVRSSDVTGAVLRERCG